MEVSGYYEKSLVVIEVNGFSGKSMVAMEVIGSMKCQWFLWKVNGGYREVPSCHGKSLAAREVYGGN
jgi:hypothetical protein